MSPKRQTDSRSKSPKLEALRNLVFAREALDRAEQRLAGLRRQSGFASRAVSTRGASEVGAET